MSLLYIVYINGRILWFYLLLHVLGAKIRVLMFSATIVLHFIPVPIEMVKYVFLLQKASCFQMERIY
jgi:hypothetical protein